MVLPGIRRRTEFSVSPNKLLKETNFTAESLELVFLPSFSLFYSDWEIMAEAIRNQAATHEETIQRRYQEALYAASSPFWKTIVC